MLKLLWRNKEETEDSTTIGNEESLTSLDDDNDNDNEPNNDEDDIIINEKDCLEWRTVIFIRHGNSIWNESTDNSLKNPAKAISAFTSGVKEYAKLKWSSEYKHEESIYVDTPLSPKGMKQAYNLSLFLKHHQQLRDQQKLLYLKQHQTIASPIKDAWRALQQYKLESHNKPEPISSLCNDAILSLTKAIQSVEYLMANAQPIDDPINNPINKKDININININIQMDIPYILDILIGKNIPSKIVCSNLRRAISTCVLSLWNRLRFNNEKIYILSCLQEIGGGINVDTHTFHSPNMAPQVSNVEKISKNLNSSALNEFYSTRIETIYNYGTKSQFLMESQEDSQKRIQLFAKWMFMDDIEQNVSHNNKVPPAIIAVGHSHWIREFFKHYLPLQSDFIGKNAKLSNCGVVAFKFYHNKKKQTFGIASNTVTVVYGSFTQY